MALYSAIANNVAYAGSSASKTILQVAATTTDKLVIAQLSVTFDGVTAANVPVEVQLMRQTTAGTGGVALATNYGVNGWDPGDGAASGTALKGLWATTEPTSSSILEAWKVSPTSGLVVQYPLGQEPIIATSGRIGLVVVGANAVNVWASLTWRE